jgi:hypothetical protein
VPGYTRAPVTLRLTGIDRPAEFIDGPVTLAARTLDAIVVRIFRAQQMLGDYCAASGTPDWGGGADTEGHEPPPPELVTRITGMPFPPLVPGPAMRCLVQRYSLGTGGDRLIIEVDDSRNPRAKQVFRRVR